jgi:putative mRNA 3-end processing factor
MNLLKFTPYSIYCPAADIHIDPWKPVARAILTHAHSDHAKPGCKNYLAHKHSEPILRMRLGDDISLQNVEYGETIYINGVKISLHPAGHIIGSAQVRVEANGEVWVVSGDYKMQNDNFSIPYEPIKCNAFVTESTFGLPVYKWQPQLTVINDVKSWWQQNIIEDKTSILMGYALGKMQRLIKNLQPFISEVYAHGAVYYVNERLRHGGFDLPLIEHVSTINDKIKFRRALVLAPSSAINTAWLRRFEQYSTAYCSGWMAIRGAKNRLAIDRGFALSDHVDWSELNEAVKESGASEVYVTHGYTDVFARWLNERGINAVEVKTMYGDEGEEIKAEANADI